MGVLDEHWCSRCKRDLAKKKDKYIEINQVNCDKREAAKEGRHTRVFLCHGCLDNEPATKQLLDELRLHGNPNFLPSIQCRSRDVCPDYKYRNTKVQCRHIYVVKNKVYCGRRHPGSVTLNRDKAMVDQEHHKQFSAFIEKYFATFMPKSERGELWPLIEKICKNLGFANEVTPSVLSMVPDEEIVVDECLVGKERK